MANYFTHFSCLLDVGTPENAARASDTEDTETSLVSSSATETGVIVAPSGR